MECFGEKEYERTPGYRKICVYICLPYSFPIAISTAQDSNIKRYRLDMPPDGLDISLSIARERRILARDNANLHVFIHIEWNRDNTGAIKLVANHARTHRVAVETHG